MTQVKIVEGTQSQSLLMKKLNTKHQYLLSSRSQDQRYLAYLQSLQKLKKQLIGMLQKQEWEINLDSIYQNIETQNKISRDALNQQKQLGFKMEREGLRKSRQKMEIQQFYKARIQQLESRIDELRNMMAEKESSFAKVLDRLSKYQQLRQPKLEDKLDDLDFVINDGFVKKIISKISSDKLRLAQQLNANRKQVNQYKVQCHKLGTTLSSKEILKNIQQFAKSLQSTGEIQTVSYDTSARISSDPATNTKNLVNLIKKQKLINDSLQRQFKQVIETNEDIINYNSLLTKSNQSKQQQLKFVKSQICVLQKDVEQYQSHFNKTLRRSKSQQSFEYEFLNLIQEKPFQTYLQALRREMQQIELQDATQNKGLFKSYSTKDILRARNEQQDFFGEVQQL